jgi:hypothetical protein
MFHKITVYKKRSEATILSQKVSKKGIHIIVQNRSVICILCSHPFDRVGRESIKVKGKVPFESSPQSRPVAVLLVRCVVSLFHCRTREQER